MLSERETMDRAGEAVGEVWRLLNESGPLTLPQLKKKLNGDSELLGFAVGWLAREDKMEILREKRSIRLLLK